MVRLTQILSNSSTNSRIVIRSKNPIAKERAFSQRNRFTTSGRLTVSAGSFLLRLLKIPMIPLFEPMMSDLTLPNSDAIAAMRDGVVGQMRFAREYTLNLLSTVPDSLWNVIPNGGASHIAWQVGHLAVSQYGLMLFRQRGRAEGDLELMPGWLRKKFGRGTIPPINPADIPRKEELLATLDRIHQASMAVVPTLSPELLAEATDMPYAVYPIKLGALLFCPLHESIHSGQIGLLRRLHGLDPVR
jgi:hypothetical protein